MFSPRRYRSLVLPPAGLDAVNELAPLYVIHSHKDELFPAKKVEQAVAQLKAKGKAVELVLLDTPGHFDIGAFVESLKSAVPWVTEVWQKSNS